MSALILRLTKMPPDLLSQAKQVLAPKRLLCDWHGSAGSRESTLHQLSPYIGKIKSSIAASLISQLTNRGDLVYDPFSGSGTIALEAWAGGRRVIANDLSPYANLLTRAKLSPYRSIEDALKEIEHASAEARYAAKDVDLRTIPRGSGNSFTLRPCVKRLHGQQHLGDAKPGFC